MNLWGLISKKRKVSVFFTEIKTPKIEVLKYYVIRLWDPLTIYKDSDRSHKLALQQDYHIGILDGVRTGSPPNPNSGCPEIQPNTTNSRGPNNQ